MLELSLTLFIVNFSSLTYNNLILSHYSVFLGKLVKIIVVFFPGLEIVPIINKFVAPFPNIVVTPSYFLKKNYGNHHKKIGGFLNKHN